MKLNITLLFTTVHCARNMPAFLAERLHQALKVGLEISYTFEVSLKENMKILLNIDGISYFFSTLMSFLLQLMCLLICLIGW